MRRRPFAFLLRTSRTIFPTASDRFKSAMPRILDRKRFGRKVSARLLRGIIHTDDGSCFRANLDGPRWKPEDLRNGTMLDCLRCIHRPPRSRASNRRRDVDFKTNRRKGFCQVAPAATRRASAPREGRPGTIRHCGTCCPCWLIGTLVRLGSPRPQTAFLGGCLASRTMVPRSGNPGRGKLLKTRGVPDAMTLGTGR